MTIRRVMLFVPVILSAHLAIDTTQADDRPGPPPNASDPGDQEISGNELGWDFIDSCEDGGPLNDQNVNPCCRAPSQCLRKSREIGDEVVGGVLPNLCDIDACDATIDEDFVGNIRSQWLTQARAYNDDEDNEGTVGVSNASLHEEYDLTVNSEKGLCGPDEVDEEDSCGLAVTKTIFDTDTNRKIGAEVIIFSRRIEEYVEIWNSVPEYHEEGRRLNKFDLLVQILIHEHRHATTNDFSLPRLTRETLAQRFAYNAYKRIWGKEPPLVVAPSHYISPTNPDYHWIFDSVYGEFEFEEED